MTIKSTTLPRFLAAPLLAGAMLLACQANVRACEGCKSSMSAETAAEDAGKGFAASIYLMLSMPMLLVGGIGYMAWKNCSQTEAPLAALKKDDAAGCNKINDILKAAATDGSYKKAWDDTLGKSGKAAPELDVSKLTNCS